MAQVRRAVGIPVIADESVYGLTDAKALARAQACDVFSIYVGKAGGLLPARRIAEFARSAGIKCTVGSNLELGIASAAMTHLAMACSGVAAEEFPCDIIGPFFYEDDVVRAGAQIVAGSAKATGKAGLGVELEDEEIERYRVR